MKPAQTSKRYFGNTNLLVFSEDLEVLHQKVKNLEDHFNQGDVIVVNHSATLPASFRGQLSTGEFVELRLASFQGPNPQNLENWQAFAFGEGSWMQDTESRPAPPRLEVGDRIVFGENLEAEVLSVEKERLLSICFHSDNLLSEFYAHGQPIQYSHLNEKLEVWDQQTIFSGPPISVEPPSASFPFNWQMIMRLKKKGVEIANVLHSAGISSSGDPELDQLLPLGEWYSVSQEAADKINKARSNGKKVIAMGTSALRAIESSWDGEVKAASGITQLKITPEYQVQSATGLISGMHEPGTSHMKILKSFCPFSLVKEGYNQAARLGYRGHEYGDISLIDCGDN